MTGVFPKGFRNAVFLTTGTMIGVGMLAVPVLLGLTGFWPGLLTMICVALLAWTAGYALAERIMDRRNPEGDLDSLYRADLGAWTRWVTVPGYLLLFYSLLITYITGAADTLTGLVPFHLPDKGWIIIFFGTASLFTVFGRTVLLRWNGLIVISMVLAFVVMVCISSDHINTENLAHHKWRITPLVLPVLCCAFAYHNIIPIVCRELNWQRRAVHTALSLGLLLAVAMLAIWLLVVVGSLPLANTPDLPSLTTAYSSGNPATVPLAKLLSSHMITAAGLVFSLLAILSSYLGVGTALSSFLCDLAPFLHTERHPARVFAITYFLPLMLAVIYPGIFLSMVGLVGGLGMILLFGILPIIAFMRQRTRRHPLLTMVMILVFLAFLAIFVIELAKVSGLLHM
jgi:tyrosine-specific transport protein